MAKKAAKSVKKAGKQGVSKVKGRTSKGALTVRAAKAPDEKPIPLAAADKVLLQEALDLAAITADEIGDRIVALGRWLLARVFRNDTEAALSEDRSPIPVWRELVRRAGGPTCRLSKRLLSVSVRMAAHDRRIQDDTFRLLDPGRKEILLPLTDETRLARRRSMSSPSS